MDTSRYARFSRPGHKMTGDCTTTSAQRREEPGDDFIHAIIDDHVRLAYAEIHSDEKAQTVTGFTERALAFYALHGIAPKRLMTDNAWEYVNNRSLKELLDQRGITHTRTRPYRPETNGRPERFHQTMGTEWAYGMTYASARARVQTLPYWMSHSNERRPHSALAGKAPISRVRSEPRRHYTQGGKSASREKSNWEGGAQVAASKAHHADSHQGSAYRPRAAIYWRRRRLSFTFGNFRARGVIPCPERPTHESAHNDCRRFATGAAPAAQVDGAMDSAIRRGRLSQRPLGIPSLRSRNA